MKIKPTNWRLWAAISLTTTSVTAFAHDYAKDDLVIDHPWARPTLSMRVPAAVYFEIVNHGGADDRLVAASTDRAEHVELHITETDETGVARMRMQSHGILAPAGASTSMETGAYHIMLIGLADRLEAGQSFPMVLTFEKAGEIEVVIKVEDRDPAANAHHSH